MDNKQEQPEQKKGFIQSILEGEEEIAAQEEHIDEEISDEPEQSEQEQQQPEQPEQPEQPVQQQPDDVEKRQLLSALGFDEQKINSLIQSGLADDVISVAFNLYQAYNEREQPPTQQESVKQPEQTSSTTAQDDIDIPIPEELLTDEYDETIKQSFLKIRDNVKKHLKLLKDKIETIEQENSTLRSIAEQYQQASVAQAFETLVSTVINRPDLFGTADSLTKETLDNRVKLASAMNEIVQGRLRSGRDVPPPDKLVEMAFRLEFGEQIAENVRQDIQRQLSKRKPVFKPTHRTASGTSANLAQLLEAEKDGFL